MIRRIRVMVFRYVLLHLRSSARLFDVFFWPVMELFVWGFFTVYLRQNRLDPEGRILTTLVTGLVFWDVLYRSQQSVGLAFMEELWTRNVLNLLISPLRSWEWVVACCLYGLIKAGVVVAVLLPLAWALYAFDVTVVGLYFLPFMANLLLLGWSLGLITTGLILRWGHQAEALIWAVPFLIQPFSAIFYPLSVYPEWLKPLCLLLPSTHVMEGMRHVVETGFFPLTTAMRALGLNCVFMLLAVDFYARMLESGRENGRLVRITG